MFLNISMTVDDSWETSKCCYVLDSNHLGIVFSVTLDILEVVVKFPDTLEVVVTVL